MTIINPIFRHSWKVDGKEIDTNLDNIRNLTPFFNVKEFGATGDGLTDDYRAIQDGLDYINSNGGGRLYFPKGTYIVGTSLIVYSDTTMEGESYGSVTLEAKSTLTDRILQNQARLGTGTDDHITIENIIFDESGQDTAVTFARVDYLLMHRCAFINGSTGLFLLTGSTYDDNHHCYFVDCLFDSSNLIGGGTDINDFGNGKDIQIIRCQFIGGYTNSGNPQISAAGMTDFIIRDSYFDGQGNAAPIGILGINGGGIYNCEILNSQEFGIKISRFTEGTPDSEIYDFEVRGNRIYNCETYGIWLRQETAATDLIYRTNISYNWIHGNTKNAILVEVADGLHITHNFVYNNSYGNVGTYHAFEFNNPSSTVAVKNIIVDYNRFFDDQGTPSQTKLFKLNYVDNFHSYRNDISNITTKYTVTNSTNYRFYDGDTDYYVGTLTRDLTAASGSVSYTGVGFQPRSIIFIGAKAGALQFTAGLADGTSNNAVALLSTTVAYDTYTGTACLSFAETAAILQTATISSFDADGFTLSWTKTGAPAAGTGRAYYLALR